MAIVGTGHRGTGMWGRELVERYGGVVEIAGLCDINARRVAAAQRLIGTNAPAYTQLAPMLREVKPETVIVTTRDDTHDDVIVAALESGANVITEKPMATTAAKIRRILDASARTGRRVDVTFNYRYSPFAAKLKELLASGVIGDVVSVDFHWYLDTAHGADYFRRWHAYSRYSGTLFVHKATHHFDLLNWYLGANPVEVFARGSLRHYGRRGPFRGPRCRDCPHAGECDFHFDMTRKASLEELYEAPSAEDGYVRDACVFREDIDIWDTMSADLLYEGGVQVTYSLNACMPIEGHHLAFNGTKGRIQLRHRETQPFPISDYDEILVMPNFSTAEAVRLPRIEGGHFGGDDRLRTHLFDALAPDPLSQRADARAGAQAALVGIAAAESARSGKPVHVEKP
ncbi:MAG TPA: Gfo/Idh/MocA family oxidoreductase [Acetobacteraceae bacterium]|nr:Gfo/Idh/MocA family oxidoreductase [Acetobacteraceae bacterium]